MWHQELRKAINIIITGVLEVVDPWNYFRVQVVNVNVIGQYRIVDQSEKEKLVQNTAVENLIKPSTTVY